MSIEFVFQPQWAETFTSGLEFQTAESISRLGLRQRGALRQNALKTFEFTSLLRGENASKALHTIRNNQINTYLVPNWQVPRLVTSKSITSFTLVTVEAGDDTDFEPIISGEKICIYGDDDNYTIGAVTLITPTTVGGVDYLTYKIAAVASWASSISDIYVFKTYEMIPQISKSDWVTDDILNLRCKWVERTIATYEPQVYSLPDLTCFPDNCLPCEAVQLFPMYVNPVDQSYNSTGYRNVFRGADVGLPDKIYLGIDTSKFAKDPGHSDSGFDPTNMLAAMQKQFNLEYVDGYVSAVSDSRHPHQVLWIPDPGSFEHSIPLVERWVWREIRNYTGADNNTYQLEVRFVAETPYGGISAFQDPIGGTPVDGAWGTLFNVYVFSNEINKTYDDGDDFGGVSYYRDDPLLYTGNPTNLAHPQLAIAANVPTTIQDPARYELYDIFSENKKICYYNDGPGLPWTGGTQPRSCMYGYSIRSCMTLTAGCETSVFNNFVTIENSEVNGMTALYTTAPGYDRNVGGLLSTSGISIKARCSPRVEKEDCCKGYSIGSDNETPYTPYVGSPQCIKAPDARGCCFSKDSQIKLTLSDKCIQTSQPLDADCITLDTIITVSNNYSRTIVLDMFNMEYNIGDYSGDIQWQYREDDINYVYRNYTDNFDDNDISNLNQMYGTFTVSGGEVTSTATENTNWGGSLILYDDETYTNPKIQVNVMDKTKSACLVMKFAFVTGSLYDCIFGQVNTVTNKIGIYRMLSNVVTTLVEEDIDISDLTDGYLMTFESDGDNLTFTVPGIGVEASLCGIDTAYGKTGFGTKAGASIYNTFDNFDITDRDQGYAQAIVHYNASSGGWSFWIDKRIMPGYISDCVSPDDCGSPICSCTYIIRSLLVNDRDLGDAFRQDEYTGESRNCGWAVGSEDMQCTCAGEQPAGLPIVAVEALVLNNTCIDDPDAVCTRWTYTLCYLV